MTTVSTRFPSLQFSLDHQEPGMAFKGHISAVAGNIINEWSRNMTQAGHTLHHADKSSSTPVHHSEIPGSFANVRHPSMQAIRKQLPADTWSVD